MKRNWFFIGAIIFFIWALINTWLSITRYGVEQGMYLWFCNIALFAIAYGLFRKDASWIISLLAIALFTQSFWIIDSIYRITAKKNLFGLIEFMYQPGYPLDEFLVSHYHFFIIPTAILALIFLKQKKYKTIKITIICSTVILGISYMFFPKEQNINCIRESCFPAFENWKGPIYSLTFALSIILVSSVLAYFIEKKHKEINFNKKQKLFAVYIYCIIIIFSAGLIIADTSYKRTLPTFNCLGPYEKEGIKIFCKYTSEFKEQQMLLVYVIENKLAKTKLCTSKMLINGKEEVMHKNLYLEPHKKYNIGFIILYPKEDAKARLSVSC